MIESNMCVVVSLFRVSIVIEFVCVCGKINALPINQLKRKIKLLVLIELSIREGTDGGGCEIATLLALKRLCNGKKKYENMNSEKW